MTERREEAWQWDEWFRRRIETSDYVDVKTNEDNVMTTLMTMEWQEEARRHSKQR